MDDSSDNRVYHASPVQGLTRLTPHVGTHGQPWVYATRDPALAAVFLGRLGGDLTCATGMCDGIPYLCERFAGAVDRRYGNVSGSIYVLSAEQFKAGQTSFLAEVVCDEEVTPLQEMQVANAKTHLMRLAAEGHIRLLLHPERLSWLPEDDGDLVESAVRKRKLYGDRILEQVKDFHPGLLDRVLRGITSDF